MQYYVGLWGAMLERYQSYVPKPTDTAELKTALCTGQHENLMIFLCMELIDRTIFRGRIRSRVTEAGGHFERSVYYANWAADSHR